MKRKNRHQLKVVARSGLLTTTTATAAVQHHQQRKPFVTSPIVRVMSFVKKKKI